MFKVVKGEMSEAYGYQQVLFQSRVAEECFNFIDARKKSVEKSVRMTAKGMKVVDVFGDEVSRKDVMKKTS
jgi:hypothetical protein